ncbi:MAG: lytic transglycosylase domain-containing protein [Acidobacteriota bacterium]|jgi:hypothetical protein|nr:lytic transglycosylase domain-containing protein [Acidobacteriota bacterium]
MKRYIYILTISLSPFCLGAGCVAAFGQDYPDYVGVATYEDLYAAVDTDGVREYTNAPRPDGSDVFEDGDDEYYAAFDAERGVYEDELSPIPGQVPPPAPSASRMARSAPRVPAPAAPRQPETVATDLASINELIEKYAEENNLDPSLIRSIIEQESGFNHRAVSRAGARGLMQLMPATAKSLGVRNSFDPEENIRAGVRHFRALMDKFNEDLELSLAAYNAGENIVSRLGRIPDYKETREYVASIKRKYEMNGGTAPVTPREVRPQPIMRYTDESGVTHLTNIRTFN